MALEGITGLALNSLNAINPDWKIFWGVLVFLFALVAFLLIFCVVLFIVSIFKHTISISELFSATFKQFGQNFSKFYKYYIILLIGEIILLGLGWVWRLSGGLYLRSGINALIFPILITVLITFIYSFVLDNSLAKSCLNALRSGNFRFTWISAGEGIRIILVGIVFVILWVLGLPLLVIPSILLGFVFPIFTFPILEGQSQPISKAFILLRKGFWDLVFCEIILSLCIFAVTFPMFPFFIFPIVGKILRVLVSFPISMLSTIYFTNLYFRLQKTRP